MEKLTCIQVDVQNTNSLQEALSVFEDQEEQVTLHGWRCRFCQQQAHPSKAHVITKCPKILFVQLKRFSTSFEPGVDVEARQEYITHRVQCEEYVQLREGRRIVNSDGAETLQTFPVHYRQVARVYHQGSSLTIGHYFAICRHTHPDGNWWYYNDTMRRLERCEDDARDAAHRVYLCLYERMD